MKNWFIKRRKLLRIIWILPIVGAMAFICIFLAMFCDSGDFCEKYYEMFPLSLILSLVLTVGLFLTIEIPLLLSKREKLPVDIMIFCVIPILGLVEFPLLRFFPYSFPFFVLLQLLLASAGFIAKLVLFIDYLIHETSLFGFGRAHQITQTGKVIIPTKKVSYEITPLLSAVLSGDLEKVKATLAEHPEQLNIAYAPNGNTPLHVAALNGKKEIMEFLLAQSGIDKDRKNNDGKTAFDLSAKKI